MVGELNVTSWLQKYERFFKIIWKGSGLTFKKCTRFTKNKPADIDQNLISVIAFNSQIKTKTKKCDCLYYIAIQQQNDVAFTGC